MLTWYDFESNERSDASGVLELDEALTPKGLALELHVHAFPFGTVALWLLEDGRSLGYAMVGLA